MIRREIRKRHRLQARLLVARLTTPAVLPRPARQQSEVLQQRLQALHLVIPRNAMKSQAWMRQENQSLDSQPDRGIARLDSIPASLTALRALAFQGLHPQLPNPQLEIEVSLPRTRARAGQILFLLTDARRPVDEGLVRSIPPPNDRMSHESHRYRSDWLERREIP